MTENMQKENMQCENIQKENNQDENLQNENIQKEGCCSCCSERKKERGDREYKDLLNRLSRIEGQVRGVKNMVESDAYCTDILTQVSAINAALNSFSRVLLTNHIKTCVTDDIREGRDETVDELVKLLGKLMK